MLKSRDLRAPRRRPALLGRWLVLSGVAAAVAPLTFIGCGSTQKDQPRTLPSQTLTQVEPQLEPPPPPPLPPVHEVPAAESSKVTVIEQGGELRKPTTLLEASELARKLKASRPHREIVAEINDENLAEYAEGGNVIVLGTDGEPAAPAPSPPESGEPAITLSGSSDPDRNEPLAPDTLQEGEQPLTGAEYWKRRAFDLRQSWRRTLDNIEELELESIALRQQFYAEEDLFIRDNQIKPAWDRVLGRLDALRKESALYEAEIDSFLQEGREAGAAPGWLNEGFELEPTPEERQRFQSFESHRPIAVPTIDERVKDP